MQGETSERSNSTFSPAHSTAEPLSQDLATDRRALIAGIGGLAAGALLASARTAQAGPLTPPVGPVASTGKTLTETEPRIAINSTNTPGDATSLFRITQPGSYYLTGNVTGVLGRNGIRIESSASPVTLDLNGFTLNGSSGSLDGVSAATGVRVTLRNGVVSNWSGVGVALGAVGVSSQVGTLIEQVRSIGNATGFRFQGIARDCLALSNTGLGIEALFNSLVVNCYVQANTLGGISAGGGSIVDSCVLSGNGATGVQLAQNAVLRNCTFQSNGDPNATVGTGCAVLGNNFAGGINGLVVTGADCRIEGNQFLNSLGTGLRVTAPGNIIIRNVASGNSTNNWNIVANNVVGPIVDRTAPGSAAIVGSSGPDSTGSSHPNANFSI